LTLNFYIDPKHFPYQYQDDLSFSNRQLLTELGSANTWLLWTLRTYLELKDRFDCVLTDNIPERGITLFFRGSVQLTQKPVAGQFWICMVADSTWHPYSHVNLFQNRSAIKNYPQSWFIRHWQQLGITRSESANTVPRKIYYFGDVANLAPELKSDDWKVFLKENELDFFAPHFSKWSDYTGVDLVLGIRSFQPGERHNNKPSSKLINAWQAGVVFIAGQDSAYTDERETNLDFISVATYDELKLRLVELKKNPELFQAYRKQSAICAERFPDAFFTNQWVDLLNKKIFPLYESVRKTSILAYYFFIAKRFLIYRYEALSQRLKR
jgi:hypothetical protein